MAFATSYGRAESADTAEIREYPLGDGRTVTVKLRGDGMAEFSVDNASFVLDAEAITSIASASQKHTATARAEAAELARLKALRQ